MLDFFTLGLPIAVGFILIIPILGVILTIWVIYDSIVIEEEMMPLEKIIWILAAFILPIIGPIVYYIIVKKNEKSLFEGNNIRMRQSDLDKLDKLHQLKEKGIITEKEFKEKKKKILEK
ncbi:MAG: putative membrane protein containing PLD-nuclease N-terminal domain [Candidatus Methanohalarchaeum thermophilum]|uniref:Membrane protein containing PLD-nuclease N-terminal domain n=1 Tax=Methanohalarchaeum thermophilum TaxID=1903181 RepID=A0A1Q6DS77_METT1|nr:MAG: putative membrane protein containing PLD-nuclease N-terminal domain [Candidatus Methanohalarchaeum thermophilum]